MPSASRKVFSSVSTRRRMLMWSTRTPFQLKFSAPVKNMDELIRQNFGPGESLWNPKCFDRLYTLREGSKVLALCTLQKWGRAGWILGDLCVAEKRKGLATRLVNKVLSKVKEPIWVDANEESNGIFAKDPRWHRTNEGPWEPTGTAWVLETSTVLNDNGTNGSTL